MNDEDVVMVPMKEFRELADRVAELEAWRARLEPGPATEDEQVVAWLADRREARGRRTA